MDYEEKFQMIYILAVLCYLLYNLRRIRQHYVVTHCFLVPFDDDIADSFDES